ncbi:MAG: hypothetical protein GY796_21300 [Chloroflexi bacterium]|nr:hypothetical protein [Chloroflexota bacterium]
MPSSDPFDDEVVVTPNILYQEAVQVYRNGRSHEARQLLQQLVSEHPQYEKGWLGLSQLVVSLEEKIVALETAVVLNPQNQRAAQTLQKLKIDHEDKLVLGQAYEKYNQPAEAMAAYKYAAKHAPISTDRHIAKKYLRVLKEQIQVQQTAAKGERVLKTTGATATLIRLAVGPLIIYTLMMTIHGGLNPLHIPLALYAGIIGVGIGSFLVVGAASTPHHPFWQKLLGSDGLTDKFTRSLMTGLGLLLITIPFAVIILSSINRLVVYKEAISATIN